MTTYPGQSFRPSAGVGTVESGVGIASEFPADGRAWQRKLPSNGSLVNAFPTSFFDVETFFLSQMFSLHATGSPVVPER
nr:hypothetical protein [Photorhabdus temperata]